MCVRDRSVGVPFRCCPIHPSGAPNQKTKKILPTVVVPVNLSFTNTSTHNRKLLLVFSPLPFVILSLALAPLKHESGQTHTHTHNLPSLLQKPSQGERHMPHTEPRHEEICSMFYPAKGKMARVRRANIAKGKADFPISSPIAGPPPPVHNFSVG